MGVGAFASRQAIAGGSAAHTASLAVREKVIAVAARALGVPAGDIDVEDSRATARTGNKPSLAFGELARLALGMPGVVAEARAPASSTPPISIRRRLFVLQRHARLPRPRSIR